MKILVVVDMQNDFIDGSLGTSEAIAIVPKVVEKIKGSNDYEIFCTLDSHYEDYLQTQEGTTLPVEHCIVGTKGWELNGDVLRAILQDGRNGCQYFEKNTFGSTDFAQHVANFDRPKGKIEEILLIGLCTDICIISNALLLKAFLPETNITVDASCCAGVTPESHRNALAAMKMCQINIINEEGE